MTSQKFAGIAIALIVGCIATTTNAKTSQVTAVLHNTTGKEVGHATLSAGSGGAVRIDLTVAGLPAGPHAAHIHEVGKCDAPDFKSAGGHFNPGAKHHGHKNPQGWHAGDLPNVVVGKNGKGKLSWVTPDVTLAADAENSVFHPGGTSIVIHANADDEMSDPAGNAGGRIACGSITR